MPLLSSSARLLLVPVVVTTAVLGTHFGIEHLTGQAVRESYGSIEEGWCIADPADPTGNRQLCMCPENADPQAEAYCCSEVQANLLNQWRTTLNQAQIEEDQATRLELFAASDRIRQDLEMFEHTYDYHRNQVGQAEASGNQAQIDQAEENRRSWLEQNCPLTTCEDCRNVLETYLNQFSASSAHSQSSASSPMSSSSEQSSSASSGYSSSSSSTSMPTININKRVGQLETDSNGNLYINFTISVIKEGRGPAYLTLVDTYDNRNLGTPTITNMSQLRQQGIGCSLPSGSNPSIRCAGITLGDRLFESFQLLVRFRALCQSGTGARNSVTVYQFPSLDATLYDAVTHTDEIVSICPRSSGSSSSAYSSSVARSWSSMSSASSYSSHSSSRYSSYASSYSSSSSSQDFWLAVGGFTVDQLSSRQEFWVAVGSFAVEQNQGTAGGMHGAASANPGILGQIASAIQSVLEALAERLQQILS